MKTVIFLFLLLASNAHAQLLLIGSTKTEIQDHFYKEEKDYKCLGDQITNDGIVYTIFQENSKNKEIAAYYFNEHSVCFMVLLTEEKTSMPDVLKVMNRDYINTENLSWVNSQGTITYRIKFPANASYFQLIAESVLPIKKEQKNKKQFWTKEVENAFREEVRKSDEAKLFNPSVLNEFIECVLIKLKETYPNGLTENLNTNSTEFINSNKERAEACMKEILKKK